MSTLFWQDDRLTKLFPLPPAKNPPLRLLAQFNRTFTEHLLEGVYEAPDRQMWIALACIPPVAREHHYSLASVDESGKATFSIFSARHQQTVLKRPLPRWIRVAAKALVITHELGLEVSGFVGMVAGDEPEGPRYDYALGILFAALAFDFCGLAYSQQQITEIADAASRIS